MTVTSSQASAPRSGSRALRWTGWAISGLVVLFLAMDGAMKLVPLEVVTTTLRDLGARPDLAQLLGVLTLIGTALYAIPATALLGAIWLTGYLGGAIYVHLAAGSPLATHLLFGVYLGVLMWLGLWLRDPALRRLLPLRRAP
jgi:hypothetical protein